jgi:hypothetical protein
MGYSTDFEGELKFTTELTAPALAKLNSMLGEDCRDHPELAAEDLNYIDLELNDDFSGIKWNGAEKTRGMVECVNLIIREMRKQYPNFGLQGAMLAQGEDIKDRWQLTIGPDGLAHKEAVKIAGTCVRCPHCDEEFLLQEAKP